MTKPQKVVTIALWTAAVGMMVGVVALKSFPPTRDSGASSGNVSTDTSSGNPNAPTNNSGSNAPAVSAGEVIAESPSDALTVMGTVPHFSLINQDNQHTSDVDLAGKPWVADFIFTSCASVCPLMSTRMMQLQKELPVAIKLVSFSVDPQNDTPAVLKQYATRYQAQDGRWTFLTGDAKTQETVIRGLKLIFSPATADQPITHDEHFVLVDSKGQVRGYYRMDKMDDLVRDASMLSGQDGVK